MLETGCRSRNPRHTWTHRYIPRKSFQDKRVAIWGRLPLRPATWGVRPLGPRLQGLTTSEAEADDDPAAEEAKAEKEEAAISGIFLEREGHGGPYEMGGKYNG